MATQQIVVIKFTDGTTIERTYAPYSTTVAWHFDPSAMNLELFENGTVTLSATQVIAVYFKQATEE